MTTRKEFIAVSSLLAAAPSIAQAAPAASPVAWTFDRDRFNAILSKPAQHKQCFGATKLAYGEVLDAMHNSYSAYAKYYPQEAFQSVAVLYHGSAIGLALNDQVWNEIVVPWLKWNPDLKKEIPEAQPGGGNPYLKQSVPRALQNGASFFVCHNAIMGFAYGASDVLHQPLQKVHDAIVAGVIPGALVVPAGVMAINACQEAKFSYIQTSV